MYNTILQIAHDIVLIGGALIIILGVVLMVVLIVIATRVNKVVTKSMNTISTVSEYIMLPFTYLSSLFSSKGDEDEEVRTVKRKSTVRKK